MSIAGIGRLQLHYESAGAGQPRVLLHGALMTAGLLAGYQQRLAGYRRVITVELQGHGHTRDIGRPLRYELLADDIAALLGQLGLGPADVAGYSLGAGVALQLALRHPAKVRQLVCLSVTFRADGLHPEMTAGADPDEVGCRPRSRRSPRRSCSSRRTTTSSGWSTRSSCTTCSAAASTGTCAGCPRRGLRSCPARPRRGCATGPAGWSR